MHLGDRCARDRYVLEVDEQLFWRHAEVALDDAPDVLGRRWGHRVAQRLHLEDEFGAEDIGSNRDQLSELDEGGAELLECRAELARERATPRLAPEAN